MELGSRLNMEQQLSMIKPFTRKEIKKDFFSIPDSKSPGPDGYGVGFFKTMWPEVGAEFTKVVENFFMTDLLKNYKRKNISPRCTLKVDISKAYDTVNWEFLEALLNDFKLLGRFISWIMTCLKATSYSVLMNGRVQGSFKGKKGLRQVMEQVSIWLGIKRWPTSFQSWQQWLLQNNRDKKHRIHVSILAAMIFSIWSNMNNCLFNKYSSTETKTT
uniref:Reverse transcriptase domain-containing protein n=1 Tax=Cannabis sativa TaxID=3483 RepID=A0A803PIG2_CANSA